MSVPQTKVSVFRRDEVLYERVLPPGNYVIGKAADAEIHVQGEGVGDRHARLDLGEIEWRIVDLESAAGTFVNDEAVKGPTIIQPGQRVRLGDLQLVLDAVPELGTEPGDVTVRRAATAGKRNGKKYAIGRTVAHGGMGVIKSAHEPALGRDVAMKVMREPTKPGAEDRFSQEAQITAQLEHPNIVPIHELGVDEEGNPYYTMKLVRGISLRRVLELLAADDAEMIRHWPLSALLTVFQKVCDALAFAHSKKVIHRDLKPANIMLGEYGEALVMDWGLAKLLGRERLRTLPLEPLADVETAQLSDSDATTIGPTISGTVMGTPQYMPPEQANGEVESMDERTDIYSLGAILYHILTLRPPFHGRTSTEVIQNVRAGQIVPFAEACGKKRLPHLPGGRLPESLGAVVLKAMSLQKGQRYATVKALQVELEAYQSGFATSAEQAGAWKLAGLFLRRNRAVSIAAGLLLLSGLIFSLNLVRAYRRIEEAVKQAVTAREVADQQRDVAEDQLYLSEMLQAGRKLEDGQPSTARQLLDRHRLEPSGRDLRDWEWFFLSGQASQERLRVNAHPGGVLAVSTSADGTRIVSGGADGEIAVWQIRGLVPQWRVAAHAGAVQAVSWYPAGKLIASGGADGCVRVWDTESHGKVAELRVGNGQRVRAVAWKPADDGHPTLAIGGEGKDILLWHPLEAGDAGRAETLSKTKNGVSSLNWSADGKTLAVGETETDRTLEVFDIANHQPLLSQPASSGNDVFSVAIDPSGRYVAAGSKHLTVSVFDLTNKKKPFVQPIHYGLVSALAWSPDGVHLASASHDGTIRIFKPGTILEGIHVLNGHAGAVNTLAWLKLPGQKGDPERTVLFSGGSDGTLRAWLPTSAQNTTLSVVPNNWIAGAQWDPKGTRIALVNFRDFAFLADPDSGLSIAIPSFQGSLFDVAWSPDGTRIATASRGKGLIQVFDTASGLLVASYALPRADRVTWSGSGRYLAGAGSEQSRIWDTRSGALLATILRPTTSLAWHPDEKRIAVGGSDGAVQIWDALAGKPLATWKAAPEFVESSVSPQNEPPHAVFDLRWSHDARYLAYATQDSIAGLFDADTGRTVRKFAGHSSGVWRLAWNPKDTRLATAGQDGTIRIFATDSGREVEQIAQDFGPSELHAIDWTADGRAILSGGYDDHVHVWDSHRGMLIDDVDQLMAQKLAQPNDVAALRSLVKTYAQLGWVDDARFAFGLLHSSAPDDTATRTVAAEAEAAFSRALDTDSSEWMTSPVLLAERRRSLGLLRQVLDTWDSGQSEEALSAYRDLAQIASASALLPFAHTYFGRAHWKATWFSSKSDPLHDPAGWRALAKGADAESADVHSLQFPYQNGGPKALVINEDLSDHGPGADHFGMIAHARIKFPAGKWRLHASGGGGVRILANDKVILENWTADAPVEKLASLEVPTTADVEVTVEHFVLEPTSNFDLTIEPAAP
ncbi:MAG TPA: protein kinase [Chthoniobacter sp.]|jgi:WD40 repeat protein/serine/threonine protein kinase